MFGLDSFFIMTPTQPDISPIKEEIKMTITREQVQARVKGMIQGVIVWDSFKQAYLQLLGEAQFEAWQREQDNLVKTDSDSISGLKDAIAMEEFITKQLEKRIQISDKPVKTVDNNGTPFVYKRNGQLVDEAITFFKNINHGGHKHCYYMLEHNLMRCSGCSSELHASHNLSRWQEI